MSSEGACQNISWSRFNEFVSAVIYGEKLIIETRKCSCLLRFAAIKTKVLSLIFKRNVVWSFCKSYFVQNSFFLKLPHYTLAGFDSMIRCCETAGFS
jgi:hypothetical protein